MMLNKEEAAAYFAENLPKDVFNSARRGVRELYSAALDCYEVSGGETLNLDMYQTWLQDQTYIYEAMGGEEGFEYLVDSIPDTSTTDPDSLIRYARYVDNKSKQKDLLNNLQELVSDKGKGNSSEKIVEMLGEIHELNTSNSDPLSSIDTGLDISSRAENMWDLPDFIPTPFKGLNEAIGYDREKGGFCKGAVHAILAASGKGKPLDVNTKILMADGSYKRLGDIEVGDRVINRKGNPDNVTEVHEQGTLTTTVMKTKSGREIRTAYDHTFLTSHGWKEVEDISVGDELILTDETSLDSHPDRDVSEFQEAGRQGNYLVPDWVERGAHSQVASFIGSAFSSAGGRVIATKDIEQPIVRAKLFGAAGRKIQSLLQRMGISSSIIDDELRVQDSWSARLFVEKIPLGGSSQRNAAKWQNRPESNGDAYKDEVVAFEEEKEVECRCLTVEDDHTFIANDFVVHNSTFAKSLMNHWVDNGLTVLYVNYEEAVSHWERILFTQVTKQNVYKAGDMASNERSVHTQAFKDKMEEWDGRFLVKHNPETQYFEDLEDWIRSLYRVGTVVPDAIIVDTIQSMFLKGGAGAGSQRWPQYEVMMTRFEKLAKDTGAAITVTAQENSNRDKEGRTVVKQSDAGGSLTIIQKSSSAIFVTDVDTDAGSGLGNNVMQLQIPKCRITGDEYSINPPLVKYNDDFKLYEDLEITPETISEMTTTDDFDGFL